jgi:dTDP-4-dehydrorhamnose 3,5-epimerase
MNKQTLIRTPLDGVSIIEPMVFSDPRGFFIETYNRRDFTDIGIVSEFVQDNHARSSKGVLRGLHFQHPEPQQKLVRVIRGEVFDVAVDIRENSRQFGKWFGVILSENNKKMLYVPEGFAHGYLALSDHVEFIYKVSRYYSPENEEGIRWDDPLIGIHWPLGEYGISMPVLSEKDQKLPFLKDFRTPFISEK